MPQINMLYTIKPAKSPYSFLQTILLTTPVYDWMSLTILVLTFSSVYVGTGMPLSPLRTISTATSTA